MASVYETIAIQVAKCPHCSAEPGHACMRDNGKVMGGCHWQRREYVQRIWRKDHEHDYQRMLHGYDAEYGTSAC